MRQMKRDDILDVMIGLCLFVCAFSLGCSMVHVWAIIASLVFAVIAAVLALFKDKK